MKKVEINGDLVHYYYKDEAGNTIEDTLHEDDERCIARDIERGKDSGKMLVGDTTLFWKVEF
jgi:hypothetical protein